MRARATACLSLVLCALLPRAVSSAAEAPRPKLVVVAVAQDADARARLGDLEHASETAVSGSGRFQLLRSVDLLDPQNAARRAALLKEAEEAVAAGQKAYDELDTVKAAQLFDAAVKAYRETDLSQTAGARSRAGIMKAASLVANGDVAGARAQITEAIGLDPSAELSRSYFSPELLAHADEARRVAATAAAEIDVRSNPAGARVYLDGRYRGPSPLKISKLAPGEHALQLVAPGFALYSQTVTPGAHEATLKPAELAARYQEAASRIAQDPQGPKRDLAAKELGQRLGADQVLLLVARKAAAAGKLDVVALRLEVRDGHNTAYEEAPVPAAADATVAAVEALATRLLAADVPRRSGKPVVHFDGGVGLSARKTAGYALLATGAALAVGGMIFGIQASNREAEFRQTPQTDPRSPQLRSAGQTSAALADVFIATGLAAGGGGGYLAFVPEKPAPAPARPVTPPQPDPKEVERQEAERAEAQRKQAAEEEARRQAEAAKQREAEAAAKKAEDSKGKKKKKEPPPRKKKGKKR